MKRFRKNNTEVEAIQYEGTIESFNEIIDLVEDEKKDSLTHTDGNRGEVIFNIVCKTKNVRIYNTEWIVKDKKYYFVVSDNIFKDFFTEI